MAKTAKTKYVGKVNGVTLREVTTYGDDDMPRIVEEVEMAAGKLRSLLIPPGEGVGMTYGEKHREALEIMQLAPTVRIAEAEFPFVAGDAEVDGVTMHEAARAILTEAGVFKIVGPAIEQLRRKAQKALKTERDPKKCDEWVASVSVASLGALLAKKGYDLSKLANG